MATIRLWQQYSLGIIQLWQQYSCYMYLCLLMYSIVYSFNGLGTKFRGDNELSLFRIVIFFRSASIHCRIHIEMSPCILPALIYDITLRICFLNDNKTNNHFI